MRRQVPTGEHAALPAALGPGAPLGYAGAPAGSRPPSFDGAMQQGSTRTSDILVRLVGESATDRVSVRAIVAALGERAYALLVVVLGLPNCLPMPPPIPLICGLLLLFVAAQIVLGKQAPWLPRRLLARTIALEDLRRRWTAPCRGCAGWSAWRARACRVFESAIAFRLVGLALLAFSLALVFAAPVIGQIPLGLAVCLVGLGLVERDGIVVIAGLSFGLVGTTLEPGLPLRHLRQRGRDLLSRRAAAVRTPCRGRDLAREPEQLVDLRGRDGLAEQEALQLVAADRLQEALLLGGLHALGRDGEPERAAQMHDRVHQDALSPVVSIDSRKERSILILSNAKRRR